jgi:hypothetical protein
MAPTLEYYSRRLITEYDILHTKWGKNLKAVAPRSLGAATASADLQGILGSV